MHKPSIQSKLAAARGHGAAKDGVNHWWLQRLTALALIPLTVWLAASLIRLVRASDPFQLADWLSSPMAAVALIALIIALFWHAKLGLQVVIEDYIKPPFTKYTLLIGSAFFCFFAGLMSVLAVLKLHFMHIVSGF